MKILIAALALFAATGALGQESKVTLKEGAGMVQTQACVACHSLDYIMMNSRFLDKAGWTGTVNKMINAFGAPIPKTDVDAIAGYLAQNYGKPAAR